MTALQTAHANTLRRSSTETLLEYVIRMTDHYLARESEVEWMRRTGRILMECKHCDKQAEWKWSDADGNEHSYICERCMVTIAEYMAAPGWQFEIIPTLD